MRPLRLGLLPDDPGRAVSTWTRCRQPGGELGAQTTTSRPGPTCRWWPRAHGAAGPRPGALGAGAVVGQGPRSRRPHDQRPRRADRRRATRTSGRSSGAAASSPPTASTSGRVGRGSESRSSRGSSAAATASRSRSRGCGRSGTTRARRRRAAASRRARSSPPSRTTSSRPIHDRMPVMLPESAWDTWLDADNHDVDALSSCWCRRRPTELEGGRSRRSSTSPTTTARSCSSRRR